jgi:opacity protein-like surface antigen
MNSGIKTLVILSAISMSQVAFASNDAYVSLGAGMAKTSRMTNKNLPITSDVNINMADPNQLSLNFKRNANFWGAVGQKMGDFRVEIEGFYLKSDYKKISVDSDGTSFNDIEGNNVLPGYTRLASLLVNAYYDLALSDQFVPYVGLGVGIANAKNHIELTTTPKITANQTENKMSYQGIAGARLYLTKQIALSADYRYLATTKLKALDSKLCNQSINVGIAYHF